MLQNSSNTTPGNDDSNKINQLESSIMKLKSELQEEKNKNDLLSNEITKLKEQINNSTPNPDNQINIQNDNNPNDLLIKLIKEKDDLIEKLKKYPAILGKNEKLISINFNYMNQNINYSLICKKSDTINNIEEELYKEYPKLTETENNFLNKAKLLDKFKTVEKNNIKSGDTIILN